MQPKDETEEEQQARKLETRRKDGHQADWREEGKGLSEVTQKESDSTGK